MKIIPKFDRVLLKRESLQTKGSVIVIPEQIAKANQSERGEVIAVGPTAGVWKDNVKLESIQVGEHVVFGKHAGIEVKVDDEVYWLVQDTDIHASFVS